MKETYNIFSKTKKLKNKSENKKIIIDYREKNCLLIAELKNKGFDIQFKELKVADYLLQGIAIERKTVSDFLVSMKNNRLKRQIEELQQYKKKIILIEGIEEQELYNEKNSLGIHSNSIRGFLLSIIIKYNIPILFTKNCEDSAEYLDILARKKSIESPLNIRKKAFNSKEQMQFVIESFPGIGPKTSKKLLKKFKTIKNIINSSEEELKKVVGKKAEIFKILEEEY
jgi:ERCC4-type nuclease